MKLPVWSHSAMRT